MGAILADCLVGLPLMRELNLRDNRLTDKGIRPIVQVTINLCGVRHFLKVLSIPLKKIFSSCDATQT